MSAGDGEEVVLGVDSGGSGLRVALAGTGAGRPLATAACAGPVRTGPAGIDAGHLLEQVLPVARELLARQAPGARVVAAAVGAAGMATLGDRLRAEVPAALAGALGVRRVALAADAVTAYAGALGQRPGAVVAGGTGLIALGTDLGTWRRADGWGHLLGDGGSGAWIGRAGLDAAMRAHDGRRGGSGALLARLEAVFGPASGLPGLLYPRTDRPALLASFAPEVAACAAGDGVAAGILRAAAAHIAEAAAAVCPPPRPKGPRLAAGEPHAPAAPHGPREPHKTYEPYEVALTGGLFKMGEPLLAPLREEFARQVPQARVVRADGDPLEGAVETARALAGDRLRLPSHPTLLFLPGTA
ncbi:ATPase [Streptomyces nitrosporeus]|uniref:ATPase n=2 Tax=Streptomyces nitrosporeus TaxID=28894 RepID=A0A5J6FKZ3_9ACTN|nr:BadF/BadG/BcrA/BcrD ATPase family protein [Streptomyces nitrosporeus]QEU76873.1 ATPase [Streptomyces nitrosporeus]